MSRVTPKSIFYTSLIGEQIVLIQIGLAFLWSSQLHLLPIKISHPLRGHDIPHLLLLPPFHAFCPSYGRTAFNSPIILKEHAHRGLLQWWISRNYNVPPGQLRLMTRYLHPSSPTWSTLPLRYPPRHIMEAYVTFLERVLPHDVRHIWGWEASESSF